MSPAFHSFSSPADEVKEAQVDLTGAGVFPSRGQVCCWCPPRFHNLPFRDGVWETAAL